MQNTIFLIHIFYAYVILYAQTWPLLSWQELENGIGERFD